jgi:hypothetical protein
MTDPKRLLNPELDRLIQEMNLVAEPDEPDSTSPAEADVLDSPPGETRGLDAPRLAVVADGEPLERLLTEMVRRRATDLLLVPGAPPVLRVDGVLRALAHPAVDEDMVRMLFAPHLGARGERLLRSEGAFDLSLRLEDPGGDA